MRLSFLLTIFLLFCCKNSFAQTSEIRQLEAQLSTFADSLHYTDALNKISLLYYERNVDSTSYYAIKARDAARRLHYVKGEADAANNLGILDEIRGNTQDAFRYYLDAGSRYSAIADKPGMVQASMNIALVYCEMEKLDKSLVNFRKAFAESRGIESDSVMAVLYANYVSCFSNRLSADSISYYITKAKEISARYHDRATQLYTDVLMAEDLVRTNQKKEAVQILEATLEKTQEASLFYSASGILIELGNIVSDSAAAAGYYLQALKLAEEKGFRSAVRYACEQLYDFYQSKGNDSLSFVYSEKLLNFYYRQKSIDNNSGVDYVDYALMDKTLAESLATSKHRQRMLWLTITICVLFFVLVIVLWRSGRRMRKAASVIKTQFAQSEFSMVTLDKLNKNYAKVIKVVAHDLRNPLSTISMAGEMMQHLVAPASEIEKLAAIIRTASEGCFELIEQLLRTDIDESFSLEKTDISLDDVLLQCVRMLRLKAKEKQQEIIVTNNLHITFSADSNKIIRVLSNLLMNAVKFSPEGRHIYVKTQPAGNNVVISVADKGIGIPETLASRIFDPFTTARRTGTNGESTFGLGLYISKQIVEAHGGAIWYKSSPGDGTTFYVELPLKTTSQPAAGLPAKQAQNEV